MDAQTPLSPPDLILGLLSAIVVIAGAAVYYAGVRRTPEFRLAMAALCTKLLACFVYSFLIILYFPGGGDSLAYHREGVDASALIRTDLFWGSRTYVDFGLFFLPGGTSTTHMHSLSGLVHFLTFDSYLASSVFFGVLGFSGQWLLYRTFTARYPDPRLGTWWRVGILFFPTLTFWSAGMLKDAVGLFGLGLTLWAVHRTLEVGRPRNYLLTLLGAYILVLFRLQVLPVLLIAVVPWVLQSQNVRSRLRRLRARGRTATVRLALVAGGIVGIWVAGKLESRFSLAAIPQAIAVQSGLFEQIGGATTQAIAVPTWSGLIASAPAALVLSLFRPFPWEAGGALGLFAALENLVLLLLTLRMLGRFRGRPGLFRSVLRAPMFTTCLVFVALYGIAVGASTPNLGSISRYRLPLIPFFVGMLAIVENQADEMRRRRAGLVAQGIA
ncbi:MAG TPA: hypothetical protein VF615_05360 [Longimicrobiaceae bacterium]|jgi:hypothetical protein